jgi:hypothetical protein
MREAVFRRFGHGLLIVALMCATGGQWAMLQSVAWATMLASNARTECLSDAVSKTFDGRHPCPLCLQIAKQRQSEKKSDAQLELKRLEYSLKSAAFVISPPNHFFLTGERSSSAPLLTESPPTPPPREIPA